jgi:hypothetical protein
MRSHHAALARPLLGRVDESGGWRDRPISGILSVPPRGAAANIPRSTMATTVNERRYVTWRLPDRQFSKVHLQRDPEFTICGKTLPRATGSPQPPIPAAAMCPECAASEA